MIMIYLGKINMGEFPDAIVLKIVSLKVKTRSFLLVPSSVFVSYWYKNLRWGADEMDSHNILCRYSWFPEDESCILV